MEVIKIISIGRGSDRGEVGGISYIKVKKDWGDDRALGDASVDYTGFGVKVIVGTVGHPATQVAGQPSGDVVVDGGGGDFGDE